MTVHILDRFRNRKQHALLATPVAAVSCRACSPEDYGPCTCPEDCGHLACTGGWREVAPAQTFAAPVADASAPTRPDYASRLDVDQAAADVVTQALADAEAAHRHDTAPQSAAPWGPWDRPGNFPEEMRAVPDEHGRVYGWDLTAMDVPPHHYRPYIPGHHAAVPAPPPPVSAAECARRMSVLAYPEPDSTRDRYAAVMRQVSAYTGTRTAFDTPGAWTSARPAPAQAPVLSWMPQRPALLAIEAGTAAAA